MNNIRIEAGGKMVPFESSKFFGAGERCLKLDATWLYGRPVLITFFYDGDQSIIDLIMVVDILKRQNCILESLYIPYFPGGRQDRVCNTGEAFSLKVYADLINGLGFESVKVFDPHSDVTPALINNCTAIPNYEFVLECVNGGHIANNGKPIVLVSPDSGANKKIFGVAKYLGGRYDVVRADKIRDVTDGKIIDTQVFCDSLEGKIALIVDDIASYGGTFKALAKKLKEKGADQVYLAVSHYEGVADEHSLKESGIDGVFTTDSFHSRIPQSDFVKIVMEF
jgi:ribose-phosphate pyrophosphokinase